MKWRKTKPNFECTFLTRHKKEDSYVYNIWHIEWIRDPDGRYYLGLCDNDWNEDSALEDLMADEYLVLHKPNPESEENND